RTEQAHPAEPKTMPPLAAEAHEEGAEPGSHGRLVSGLRWLLNEYTAPRIESELGPEVDFWARAFLTISLLTFWGVIIVALISALVYALWTNVETRLL